MTGTKFGCGMALCGACTVHVDGEAGALLPAAGLLGGRQADHDHRGYRRTTEPGKALQQAWVELDVPQCGYCQAGQIMSAAALLARAPTPSDSDIDAAMSGNICRCGTYLRIRAAIKQAAARPGEAR